METFLEFLNLSAVFSLHFDVQVSKHTKESHSHAQGTQMTCIVLMCVCPWEMAGELSFVWQMRKTTSPLDFSNNITLNPDQQRKPTTFRTKTFQDLVLVVLVHG